MVAPKFGDFADLIWTPGIHVYAMLYDMVDGAYIVHTTMYVHGHARLRVSVGTLISVPRHKMASF